MARYVASLEEGECSDTDCELEASANKIVCVCCVCGRMCLHQTPRRVLTAIKESVEPPCEVASHGSVERMFDVAWARLLVSGADQDAAGMLRKM